LEEAIEVRSSGIAAVSALVAGVVGIAAVPAQAAGVPRWVTEGKELVGSATAKTSGNLTMKIGRVPTLNCKVKDVETITNPASTGEAGTDEVTAFKVGKCTQLEHNGPACKAWKVTAMHLPWRSQLTAVPGPQIVDAIEGVSLNGHCRSRYSETITPLEPVRGRVGAGVLEFEERPLLEGVDDLKGKGKNKTVTAALF
jgi:hypothetical protein